MSYEDLKREALKLAKDERADLAQSLIRSLDAAEQEEDLSEIERLWAEEAERRYQEILDGKVKAVPGEEAMRRARAALR
jgi:putative addiction module component (TIGR02574 family)